MTNSNAPDTATKAAAATDRGPVAQEFALWLQAIRLGWTQSVRDKQGHLTDKQKHRYRLKYALSGSFTWLIGTIVLVLGDPRFFNLINMDLISIFAALLLIFFASWLGWLVAFVDRGAGPIRLFLDGLLLPAATIAIIAVSAQRIPSGEVERPASTIILQPESENADDTPD